MTFLEGRVSGKMASPGGAQCQVLPGMCLSGGSSTNTHDVIFCGHVMGGHPT